MNKSSVDRGLFCATTYKTITVDEKKKGSVNETITVPEYSIRKKGFNYSILDHDGIVRKGVYVRKNDVIVGKTTRVKNKDGEKKDQDCSIVVKASEEGIVDEVFKLKDNHEHNLVKIRIRKIRIPEIGDKVAARSAQKGTIGALMRHEDMPFTEDGMVPDIIMNTHAFPSRMTINQLMETVLGKACCENGGYGDATPFGENSVDIAEKLCEELEKVGFEGSGKQTMYNGMTGEKLTCKIFIGPTYYQRLKHLVSDKMHARADGPVTMLTRQPLEGRSKDGGSKCLSKEKFNSALKPWRV